MRRSLLLSALIAALVAGCGGDDEEEAAAPAPTAPAETSTDAGQRTGGGEGGVKLAKVGDFEAPVFLTQPPDGGDLYVVEQGGTIRVVRDGETLEEPFLDVSDEVNAGGEQGLLSLAFAPDFAGSRLLYVYFTDTEGDQRVVEFRASEDGTTVDEGSRREVLKMDDFAPNHNGGLLLFGADGHLYIGTGDGGIADDPERNGQDLNSLLGKILRIDPQASGGRPYGIPADNPFADQEGARPEVYAYGLRNPWRFSFDRENQDLWIGDVGQNEQEEVDYAPAARSAGANFGWSAFEGTQRFNEDQQAPGAIPPILTYPTAEGCAVTGGYVVRDPSLTSLVGRYLYADFCAGELRSLAAGAGGRAKGDRSLGLEVPQVSSFAEDIDGRVYALSLDGPVYRLAPGGS